MKTCFSLIIMLLSTGLASQISRAEVADKSKPEEVGRFIDLDGDGIDDNARDLDDDGIPDAFGTNILDDAKEPAIELLATQHITDISMDGVFEQGSGSDAKPSSLSAFLLRKHCARDLTQVRGGFDSGAGDQETGGGRPVTCVGGVCF